MDGHRTANQPFNIDRLPPVVHRAISELYAKHGLTWEEIEDLSAAPFGQAWDDTVEEDENGNVSTKTPAFKVHPGRGFVPWGNLPLSVLELFPDLKLPKSSLHRWYRKRVLQVQQQMMEASERSREIAQAFAAATVDGQNEAVLNAARDQLMVVLSEDATARGKLAVAKAMIVLAEVMQSVRANDIKERKVAVDERRIEQLEKDAEVKRRKMDEETAKVSRKATKGEVKPEDIDRLRERVFGLPPVAKAAG